MEAVRFLELAGLATTFFFETGFVFFDADFLPAAAVAFFFAVPVFFEEVFFEVPFVAFLAEAFLAEAFLTEAFLAEAFVAFLADAFVAFLEAVFLPALFVDPFVVLPVLFADDLRGLFAAVPAELLVVRFVTLLRPAEALPPAARVRAVFLAAALLLLPVCFFFFLAAAFLAGIQFASKSNCTKRAIIHTPRRCGSLPAAGAGRRPSPGGDARRRRWCKALRGR